jgi:hypothetical protein
MYPEWKNDVKNRAVLEHWKYRSKRTLPQIAHLRCRKSRCIAIGILTFVFTILLHDVVDPPNIREKNSLLEERKRSVHLKTITS